MPGILMPIGGAEDKHAARLILSHFAQLCGADAHIVVIPSASKIPHEVSDVYSRIFSQLGARQVSILHIPERRFANDNANFNVLNEATGLFITGGDQMQLMSRIGGTPLEKLL